ncbi:MAG: AMP-binding protein [Leucobacter sp.]|nr:AMP-binding protein [Leucobacter sp.]
MLAALDDALSGGTPVYPAAPGTPAAAVQQLREAELPEGTSVVVRTSGSSGVPKAVALSAAALRASAAATHERLGAAAGRLESDTDTHAGAASDGDPAATTGGQWLVTLPGHLISGLQMLVRSHLAGTEPVFLDGPFDPAALLAAAERMEHPRRYVSLVPVQLARVLALAEADAGAADALRGFSGVLVGGQAVPRPLRQRAHDLGVALRRSYGMTETAGGCVYDGVEIGDTRVRIRRTDAGGGEVQLTGSCLALGYVDDPALTSARFIEDAAGDGSATRWYRTGDAGELLGGMLTVTGRLDRVIISGGVNVSLDEVERVVHEQPGWEGAVALGTAHPEWGERVALAVEIGERADPSRAAAASADPVAPFAEVQAAVKAALGPAAAPVWATEAEALPRLPGGKPDLPAIEAWLRELRASFAQLRSR